MIHMKKESISSPHLPQSLDTLFFPEGLIGFRHIKHMSLAFFKIYKEKSLYILDALHERDHTWIIIQHHDLDLPPLPQEHMVFYTVKLNDKDSNLLEASLIAPITIHKKSMEGYQRVMPQAMESITLGLVSEFTL